MSDEDPVQRDSDRLRSLLGPRKAIVALLSVSSAAGGFVEAAFLVLVTRAAFAIADGQPDVEVFSDMQLGTASLVSVALALVVLRIGLGGSSAWFGARLSSQVVASMRRSVATAYLGASWPSQQGERGGRLQELLTTFANRGADLARAVAATIVAACTLAALLVAGVVVDPFACLAVVGSIICLSAALRPLRRAVRGQAHEMAEAGMEFATSLSQTSRIGMEAHIFNVQPVLLERVLELVGLNERVNRRMVFLQGLVPVVYSGLAYGALVVAIVIGANIDSSSFQAVGAVMLIMLRSLTYGQAVQSQVATIHATLPFLDALRQEVQRFEESAVADAGLDVGRTGTLSLASASFSHEQGQPVLHDLDVDIRPGEVVGIVGPSGSGKTTLAQLLLGLRRPTAGRVLSDGREVGSLGRAEWASKVAAVPQQARLISGTISENIRFMRDDIEDADVVRAAQQAHLHDEIMAFIGGYDRQLGDGDSQLSGGQTQRLMLARALAGSPEVLVLDEPTSALDVQSEMLVRETLKQVRGQTTVVIIAHRLSTLDICDRIMVLEGGRLVGYDTPAALERSSDFYRDSLRLSGLR